MVFQFDDIITVLICGKTLGALLKGILQVTEIDVFMNIGVGVIGKKWRILY